MRSRVVCCRQFGSIADGEILPRSVVRRITSREPDREPPDPMTASVPRMNEMNIQMLSAGLYRQIFGALKTPAEHGNRTPAMVDRMRSELIHHGLQLTNPVIQPEVDVSLPPLRGANIEEHFHSIAEEQCAPYRALLETLLAKAPEMPARWSTDAGWTRYDPHTGTAESVAFPNEQALVLDVEVCVSAGSGPVIATALSPTSWYSWVSSDMVNGRVVGHRYQLDEMIPLESGPQQFGVAPLQKQFRKPKVVIGHNVSYDRARVREQYWLPGTALRFVDTMSLHVCVSGITSYQRAMLKSSKKLPVEDVEWSSQSSLNNLADVYQLYCGGTLDKAKRDVFVEGSLDDVRADLQSLLSYCAGDVRATRDVLVALWPLFLERFPHPATFAGMLEIGCAYLPVSSNWQRYLSEADLAYEDLKIEAKQLLEQRANSACALQHDAAYRKDLWLWDQDWSTQELKLKAPKAKTKKSDPVAIPNETIERSEAKRLADKFAHLYKLSDLLPVKRPLLPGYPAWYRNLCSKPDSVPWTPGPHKIGTGMQIAPKLLSLCWEGFPLHFIRGHGWGFLVPHKCRRDDDDQGGTLPLEQLAAACPVLEIKPSSTSRESMEALSNLWKDVEATISRKDYYSKRKKTRPENVYKGSGVWCNLDLENCCYFLKLPHKDGVTHRVGNPLSKDFLNKFSENVLAGDGRTAERVVAIARTMSYWRNNRDRITGQLVVWLGRENLPQPLQDDELDYGAILPQVVVCGTLTRRSMEPTWMTASNAQPERIGSELRAMVQAPKGYRIVGADVDSQELWIASVLGDAHAAGMHGATPFGWMTLSGTKATKTDMHSVTAQAVGISRDHAKVINYARIYGAGQPFAERLLKQFNPTFSDAMARSKAMKMFALTKGKRHYYLREEFRAEYPNRAYTSYEALQLAKVANSSVAELFERARWEGGTESAMFNRLEQIAESAVPVTPFLGGRLSRALEPKSGTEDRFLPTRINWVVQSGAVDFLHLMLVSMRWLMGGQLRFCLSFHDEVRYLVEERYAYRAAMAMHVTNLLTRAFCAYRAGLQDLPQSVAFFSSVEVDTVLRKEAHHDCRTPSNPHGMTAGYGIANGESLDVYASIAKLGNDSNIARWQWHQIRNRSAVATRKNK